ncbi:endonuclease-reverse transcriptase [Apostichopus japonicus]|uniref:Endonuclease-reverse transcriptase n=1 Tax=Stichopus japonicus TaxID=307972 RepID=A0A2G8L9X2_STIJA|nr:endonuclease-reverse transcriptase [Apostichopus japonicus]
MTNSSDGINVDIRANGEKLETVQSFKYLGAIVTDEGSGPEILSRIAQTTSAVTKLKLIWKDRNITLRSMIRLMRSLVTSIFLCACESWTLTADIERRIQAVEMRCFRRLLNISYRDHISNQEVRNRIAQAIGPYDDLLTIVKKRKLRWYGHVTRSTGLAKTILQGTVPGGRRRGRQRKRWETTIPEWTGLKTA